MSRASVQRDPELEARLSRHIGGRPVHAFQQVGSTMEVAHQLAAEGAAEGTLVVAARQEQGRGRQGRTWASPEGGAYCSLILRPARPPSETPQLSLVAGLAAAEAIRDMACLYPAIRWPNDLLLREKKVAGILTEQKVPGCSVEHPRMAAGDAEPGPPPPARRPRRPRTADGVAARQDPRPGVVIIGIGINVATNPAQLPEGSTSLAAEGAPHVSREELLAGWCRRFSAWYEVWTRQGFGPIREALRPWIGLFGHPVQLTAGSEQLQGTAQDLDESGRLLVRLDSGVQRAFEMGEVALLR
ncbi:MAG: biotin--[acetyl-CoA-carboxylase] ligase [Candidatus Omnitrophica bacterium]|nr:biotin--[acetyl-CoA-carboxylase] ligase [Candidatus Omnitrophota bacterium]